MSVIDLVREDLRDFAGYGSARKTGLSGSIWLNANESPWPSPADAGQGLNRYPDPQPALLRGKIASLAKVSADQTLVTRGSDEAIDLLVRALCQANRDSIVVSSPTFGMYAIYARIQGANVIDVPLIDADGQWRFDVEKLTDTIKHQSVKILFICTPSNPTGQAITFAELEPLLICAQGKTLVVVDEAYIDYADMPSAVDLMSRYPHLAILRTLSKAYALAGARIGAVIADAQLIKLLSAIAPPYPLPTPSVNAAIAALSEENVALTTARVRQVIEQRAIVTAALGKLPCVSHVYDSYTNYVLVRFNNAELAMTKLLAAGVVVRDMRANAALSDALRITIGSSEENQALLNALASLSMQVIA